MATSNTIILPSLFDYHFHKNFVDSYSDLLQSPEAVEIILDFSRVEYLDSAALGMMVLLHKKAIKINKMIKIKSAKGATEEILKMANMQRLFEFI